MYQNAIYIYINADFWRKSADVSKTQEVCQVIHIIFASSLGKV